MALTTYYIKLQERALDKIAMLKREILCLPSIDDDNLNEQVIDNLNQIVTKLENIDILKFPLGTEVKIIDNFHEHKGYVEGNVLKIVGYDDYDNYILSGGYVCSEAELEIY